MLKYIVFVLFGLLFSNLSYASETVNIVDFVRSYNNSEYTDVKKKVLRDRSLESLGNKRLYVEKARVINLHEYDDEYRLLVRVDGFYSYLDISVSCVYDENPPEQVINLNVSDYISLTGRYNKQQLGIILLTDCEVILPQSLKDQTIIPER